MIAQRDQCFRCSASRLHLFERQAHRHVGPVHGQALLPARRYSGHTATSDGQQPEHGLAGHVSAVRASVGQSVSGTITQNLRFPGQYFDVESGWNHNGFRDYIPDLGRYIEPDPLAMEGSARYYNPQIGRFINEGPLSSIAGVGFCWKAKFENDATHDPKCCEVRQLISWNMEQAPHRGFQPPRDQPNQWYEDRDQNNKRYGRRNGPYSDLHPGFDWYSGNGYSGNDTPRGFNHGDILRFRLIVVDVCNGGKTIYTSNTLNVNF